MNIETNNHKKSVYSNAILAIDYFIDYIENKQSASYLNSLNRPSQQSLRSTFESDDYIRNFLIVNTIAKDLGFEPLFFDFLDQSLFDKDSGTGLYALHHKEVLRSWSIYIRDFILTTGKYHGVYRSSSVSEKDAQIVQKGLEMLIEIGLDNYKKSVDPPITSADINAVFKTLGGGSQYRLQDGRTVMEWWEHGSLSGVQSTRTFADRLEAFNGRIKYLADNNKDYKKLIGYYYSAPSSGWFSNFDITLKMYESMSINLNSKVLLHLYLHLEDIDFIRDTWGVW